MTRSVNLPGGRADVRDRAGTVAMHLLLRTLRNVAITRVPRSDSAAVRGGRPAGGCKRADGVVGA